MTDNLEKVFMVLFVGFMLLAVFWLASLMLLAVTCSSHLGPYISICQAPKAVNP